MEDFCKLEVDSFLDRLAERVPTPGGGSVAALAGALSCAMARMVAAYSIKKDTDAKTRETIERVAVELRRADELARGLLSQDAVAYTKMTRASKAAREDAKCRPEHEKAVLEAIAVPMEIAAVAAGALRAMEAMQTSANRYLISDLGVGAVLARATAEAARYSVRVNAREVADTDVRTRILAEIDRIVGHAGATCETITAYVDASLQS